MNLSLLFRLLVLAGHSLPYPYCSDSCSWLGSNDLILTVQFLGQARYGSLGLILIVQTLGAWLGTLDHILFVQTASWYCPLAITGFFELLLLAEWPWPYSFNCPKSRHLLNCPTANCLRNPRSIGTGLKWFLRQQHGSELWTAVMEIYSKPYANWDQLKSEMWQVSFELN